MTSKKFLKLFAEISGAYHFTANSDLRGWKGHRTFCPITAVYHHLTGRHVHCDDAIVAAEEMGLNMEFAQAIIQASDHASVPWQRELLSCLPPAA